MSLQHQQIFNCVIMMLKNKYGGKVITTQIFADKMQLSSNIGTDVICQKNLDEQIIIFLRTLSKY